MINIELSSSRCGHFFDIPAFSFVSIFDIIIVVSRFENSLRVYQTLSAGFHASSEKLGYLDFNKIWKGFLKK